MSDLITVVAVVLAAAGGGWALGQRLPARAVVVSSSAVIVALAVGFLIALSASRPHDANIGAGLLLGALAMAVVATPFAVVSARR